MQLTVVQTLPALEVGGVERGTLEVASALVERGHRSIVISAGGRLVKTLVTQGSEHINLPIGNKSIFSLRYVKQINKILTENNVSILHSRSRFPAWISYLALKSISSDIRPRFVTTVHGPYTVNRYSKIMTKGNKVIAISEYIRDYIFKNYPDTDKSKIEVIYRGVSPEEFPYGYQPSNSWLSAWHTQYPQLTDKYIVTLPARVTRWKGHEDFLEIIRAAARHGLPVYGLVAGGPHPGKESFLDTLKNSAQKNGINDRVIFLGHRNDMRDIMAISDVIFSLAREPEAFGRTALEALSIGKPVIAYNHGGAAEVLNAIFPSGLVEPMDTTAACNRLNEFFQTRPVVDNKTPFTLKRMLDNTINLYEGLI